MATPDPIGVELRRLREARGWSLDAVAAHTNGRFSSVAVGSYERGDRRPSTVRVRELLAVYGCTLAVVHPGERVVSGQPDATEHIEWYVVYGGSRRVEIACPSEEIARDLAVHTMGATVGYRLVHTTNVIEEGTHG